MRARHQDWPARLARFVAAARARPFAWGEQDCATFARDWIEECTGERVFDAPYSDATSAARYVVEQGGMLAAVKRVLGEPMPNPAAAGRGDVALVSNAGREVMGVVVGEHVAAPAADGVLMSSRSAMIAAWSV